MPICQAQERMGKNDATLLTAEGCFRFIFKSMKKIHHPFSELMHESVKKRFLERRNKPLVTLMKYLKDPDTPLGLKHPIFSTSTRKDIRCQAQSLISRLFDIDIVPHEVEIEMDSKSDSDEMDLDNCITECTQVKVKPNVYQLSKDMQWFEGSKKLTPMLKKLSDALDQISPTSIPSEREFSVSSNFMSKKRTKFQDHTLDNLCFLRDVFKKEEPGYHS